MNKSIFDEALETLLSAGAEFIAVPCNPIGEENSDMIHLRDATPDYERGMIKVSRALELGKLYEEFHELYHMRFSTTSGADDLREADKKIKKFYEGLEDE